MELYDRYFHNHKFMLIYYQWHISPYRTLLEINDQSAFMKGVSCLLQEGR
jgi:hypothetical protein